MASGPLSEAAHTPRSLTGEELSSWRASLVGVGEFPGGAARGCSWSGQNLIFGSFLGLVTYTYAHLSTLG